MTRSLEVVRGLASSEPSRAMRGYADRSRARLAFSAVHRSSSATGTSRLRPRRTSRSSGATLASKKSGPTPMAAAASAGVRAMRGMDAGSFFAISTYVVRSGRPIRRVCQPGGANAPGSSPPSGPASRGVLSTSLTHVLSSAGGKCIGLKSSQSVQPASQQPPRQRAIRASQAGATRHDPSTPEQPSRRHPGSTPTATATTLTPYHSARDLLRKRRIRPPPWTERVMISIGKLGAGQENYYLDKVAEGAEDYYSGEGEAQGEWMGDAAEELGLFGEIDPKQLTAMLTGHNPVTGEPLGLRAVGGRGPVPGFDLT